MKSTCPKFFCRVHGACDVPVPTSRVAIAARKSHAASAWGLLVALLLAFAPYTLASRVDVRWVVAWSALWIALFPMVSGARPRRTLLWALIAASLTPLAVLTFSVRGGNALTDAGSLLLSISPVYAAALVAVLVTRVVNDLRSQVSNAEQLGVYQLESRIAQGGMGEVWKAKHALLSRPAAIKLIKPKRLSDGSELVDDAAKQRFEREAQTTASLQSPHTVELYDFGATKSGTFYYVMEFLGGSTLEQLVKTEGPLEPARVVHILRQVLDSLAEAHERGLVHRDIKPANVVVSRRGVHDDFVKVLDFGLVQTTESGHGAPAPTETVQGTPAFMAPEAVTGSAPVDGRSDLYSLGCVAYWLLTGTLVFAGRTPTQMAIAHVVEPVESPSERLGRPIPWELERLVLDCLAKEPTDRPKDALDMLARLDRLDLVSAGGLAPARAATGGLQQVLN